MKPFLTFLFIGTLFANVSLADNWTPIASFPGTPRNIAFSFVIGSKAYVGTGYDSTANALGDFWEYDQLTNSWIQKADFAGGPRIAAVGFSINGKGYAGFGQDLFGLNHNDLWEYDPPTDTWIQKNNFPGLARSYPVTFTIGNSVYLATGNAIDPVTGYDSVLNDLWVYQPMTDNWAQKENMPTYGRGDAVGFAVDGNGYVGTGFNYSSPSYLNDFWQYSPVTDQWTQKANVPGDHWADAVAFAICSKGYVTTGESQDSATVYHTDLWQYDPSTNQWIQQSDFPGQRRDEAVAFVIGDKAYVGLGGPDYPIYHDAYAYTPDSCSSHGDGVSNQPTISSSLYPNPITKTSTLTLPRSCVGAELQLTDVLGRVLKRVTFSGSSVNIRKDGLPDGVYSYKVVADKRVVSTGRFVIE